MPPSPNNATGEGGGGGEGGWGWPGKGQIILPLVIDCSGRRGFRGRGNCGLWLVSFLGWFTLVPRHDKPPPRYLFVTRVTNIN